MVCQHHDSLRKRETVRATGTEVWLLAIKFTLGPISADIETSLENRVDIDEASVTLLKLAKQSSNNESTKTPKSKTFVQKDHYDNPGVLIKASLSRMQ